MYILCGENNLSNQNSTSSKTRTSAVTLITRDQQTCGCEVLTETRQQSSLPVAPRSLEQHRKQGTVTSQAGNLNLQLP